MKSQRRAPPAAAGPAPTTGNLAAGRTLSTQSLKSNSGDGPDNGGNGAGNEDWLPPKVLLKPPGQLQLSEAELNEELTRILNANNPHAPQNIARYNNKEMTFKASPNVDHLLVHFEFDGYLLYKGDDPTYQDSKSDGATSSAAATTSTGTGEGETGEGGEEKKPRGPLRNQFNFSERAAQTLNNPFRERSTNTEPPPQRDFNFTVNQWSIYDAYMEDLLQKEKAVKDKSKSSGAGGAKGHRDEDKQSVLPAESHGEDVYYKNAELRKAITIVERMANQNTFDDIAQDYKYWEDASDELGDRKSGTLLPLWKFVCEKEKRKQVTSICWNPENPDLFVVGYGSYDFTRQGPGMIACFTLKNPSYPEYLYVTDSGVMCIDFHPQHPSMIAVGLYDGNVLVYNLQKKNETPIFRSSVKSGKHSDPVWQVCWQKDDLDDNLNFFSISSDGRVNQWTLLQNELSSTDVIHLRYDSKNGLEDGEDDVLFNLAGGTCFDFHKSVDHLFVVGTEEGEIHKCSKSYNNQYLMSYEGHQMSVYAVRYNNFHGNVFLSASADWTVKLWDHSREKPLASFDLNSSVGDIAWAPYSSTVFAAVTAEGKVFVFDLNENKYEPICEQQVVRKAKLTHCKFNPFEPILLVGDDKGAMITENQQQSRIESQPAAANGVVSQTPSYPVVFKDRTKVLEGILLNWIDPRIKRIVSCFQRLTSEKQQQYAPSTYHQLSYMVMCFNLRLLPPHASIGPSYKYHPSYNGEDGWTPLKTLKKDHPLSALRFTNVPKNDEERQKLLKSDAPLNLSKILDTLKEEWTKAEAKQARIMASSGESQSTESIQSLPNVSDKGEPTDKVNGVKSDPQLPSEDDEAAWNCLAAVQCFGEVFVRLLRLPDKFSPVYTPTDRALAIIYAIQQIKPPAKCFERAKLAECKNLEDLIIGKALYLHFFDNPHLPSEVKTSMAQDALACVNKLIAQRNALSQTKPFGMQEQQEHNELETTDPNWSVATIDEALRLLTRQQTKSKTMDVLKVLKYTYLSSSSIETRQKSALFSSSSTNSTPKPIQSPEQSEAQRKVNLVLAITREATNVVSNTLASFSAASVQDSIEKVSSPIQNAPAPKQVNGRLISTTHVSSSQETPDITSVPSRQARTPLTSTIQSTTSLSPADTPPTTTSQLAQLSLAASPQTVILRPAPTAIPQTGSINSNQAAAPQKTTIPLAQTAAPLRNTAIPVQAGAPQILPTQQSSTPQTEAVPPAQTFTPQISLSKPIQATTSTSSSAVSTITSLTTSEVDIAKLASAASTLNSDFIATDKEKEASTAIPVAAHNRRSSVKLFLPGVPISKPSEPKPSENLPPPTVASNVSEARLHAAEKVQATPAFGEVLTAPSQHVGQIVQNPAIQTDIPPSTQQATTTTPTAITTKSITNSPILISSPSPEPSVGIPKYLEPLNSHQQQKTFYHVELWSNNLKYFPDVAYSTIPLDVNNGIRQLRREDLAKIRNMTDVPPEVRQELERLVHFREASSLMRKRLLLLERYEALTISYANETRIFEKGALAVERKKVMENLALLGIDISPLNNNNKR
ncbi:cytoplasmic dynein with WD40 domain [Chytridiales sp. JEL 0842]|nr:cytoplasmic dynein with WD40 domain [Chytridiales sp. JEL 0842]